MIVTDLRGNTGYTGYDMPPQQIPTSKKTTKWKEECMDSLENIGIRYLRNFYGRFADVERLVKGGYKYKDFTKSSVFLSELDYWRAQADIATNMTHYPFLEPLLNQLVMDYIKKPSPFIISTEDEFSVNDFIETQTELLWSSVQSAVTNRIKLKAAQQGLDLEKQEFESEEEKQAFQEQTMKYFDENTPEEIKEYMGTSYKPMYLNWAEKTLKESEQRFYFEDKFTDTLYDMFLYGRCFIHHKVGFDFYEPEIWNPKNTFTSVTHRQKYVELGDYVGNIEYYSANEIIVKWGSKLTHSQKRDITRSKYYSQQKNSTREPSLQTWVQRGGGEIQMLPHKNYYEYENAKFFQDNLGVDLGVSDWFGENINTDTHFLGADSEIQTRGLIRVTEAYWVGYQQIGRITTIDKDTGELVTEIVTDDILKDYLEENGIKSVKNVTLEEQKRNPQPDTIVWDYVEQVYHGVKIDKQNTDLTNDLYIDIEPVEYQLKGESNIYGVKLPVTGLVLQDSLASKVAPYQVDYTMALNMAKDYGTKELGVFFLMDMAYLPSYMKEMKAEEKLSEIYEVVRELGLLPIDSSSPEAQRSKFNQFTQVNMDLTQAIIGKINYAMLLKRQAFEVIGLNPERLGMPSEQTTATGINIANNASFSQTEMWYRDFSNFQNRTYEIHLNVAQYAKQNDKDSTVFFADSDTIQNFLRITDPYLTLRKFKVYAQNNNKGKSILENIKQYFLQDNTVPKDIGLIADIVSSDSLSKVKQYARLKEREIKLMQQQAQQAELQKIEAEKAAETEKAELLHRHKLEEIRLKGEIDYNAKALVALGFDDNKDRNANNNADVLDQLDLSLKALKQQADNALREKQLEVQLTTNSNNLELQRKNLLLKEKELAIKDKAVTIPLEVARENKYSYEMKNNNKSNK